jgi:pimeloyl-ACP methyl ester carboxylesterase
MGRASIFKQGGNNMTIYHKTIGEGFPIVMLHGWTLDHIVMLHAMEPLFEKRDGWKRIYVDLPGMGQSLPQPSIQNSDDMLEAVLQLLDEIIPEGPFAVCGYSYGGYLARGVAYSRQERVRGLMLLAPVAIAESADRTLPQHAVLKKDSSLISGLSPEDAEEFCSVGVVQGEGEWERFQKEILLPSRLANAELLERIQTNGYGFSFDISAKLDCPALIVTGRQDHITGYRDTWELIEDYPRATFAVLDMAGHNLQIEQADVFNALVDEWLNRLEAKN